MLEQTEVTTVNALNDKSEMDSTSRVLTLSLHAAVCSIGKDIRCMPLQACVVRAHAPKFAPAPILLQAYR